jgi:diaminopimelate decarboxylase
VTLESLIPSLRGMVQSRLEKGIWPAGARATAEGDLVVGGVPVTRLAATFGTPVYVLDEAEVRSRCRAYRAALPGAETAYAGTAMLCDVVLRWVEEEGLSLRVSSRDELAVARSAGFPAYRILLHGTPMSRADVEVARAYGVGRFVLGCFDDIERLGSSARPGQPVLLAVDAGVGARCPSFPVADGTAAEAVRRVTARSNLRLVGLHCHLGSQIGRVGDYELAARRMVGLMGAIRDEHRVALPQVDLGGGHTASYVDGGAEFDLHGFAYRVGGALSYECGIRRLPTPHLIVEPGRAVVASAGLTLYRVTSVASGRRRTVALDGLATGPTGVGLPPVLRLVGRVPTAPLRPATIAGGTHDVLLPDDIRPGDLVVMPRTGAYHYPRSTELATGARPPVLAVAAGAASVVVRRGDRGDVLARAAG